MWTRFFYRSNNLKLKVKLNACACTTVVTGGCTRACTIQNIRKLRGSRKRAPSHRYHRHSRSYVLNITVCNARRKWSVSPGAGATGWECSFGSYHNSHAVPHVSVANHVRVSVYAYVYIYIYVVAVCIWARVKYYISQLRYVCVCVFVRSALRAISSNQQVCAFSPKHAHCSKTPQTPENPITLSCARLPYPPYIVSEFCANKISLLILWRTC